MAQEDAKRAAARTALAYVPESGIIGLGTGSTAKYFIEGVAELIHAGRRLVGVPTSEQSAALARSLGIPLASPDGPWDIDLCVDGADEVSAELDLIKGGGGAQTREKIVNAASRKNVIVIDASKLSARLGERWPVPVEVLAFGHRATASRLTQWGEVSLRHKDGQPWLTDAGNYLYDVRVGTIETPLRLDSEIRATPGVVETGLFCGRADVVLVAAPDGVRELCRS